MLADEINESGVKFEYWHLRFTKLTMTPSVDLSLEPGIDKLLVSCVVTGRKQEVFFSEYYIYIHIRLWL